MIAEKSDKEDESAAALLIRSLLEAEQILEDEEIKDVATAE